MSVTVKALHHILELCSPADDSPFILLCSDEQLTVKALHHILECCSPADDSPFILLCSDEQLFIYMIFTTIEYYLVLTFLTVTLLSIV
jgi:hypothetical protein